MCRIVIGLASTVTIVVLLFGYHTSTNSPSAASGATSTSVPAPPRGSSTPAASGPPSSGSSSGTKTFTGKTADTRRGPVEVEITVVAGKITKVDVPVYPSRNGRNIEINDEALPVLVQKTLDAQSANIDMVSGATVTSDAYVASLQSALDQAGI